MKMKLYLMALTLFVTIYFISCSGDKNNQQQFRSVPVSSYTVKKEKASYYVDYPGTVVALNEVEIRPEVSGYLTDINFKDGQHVNRGMKLYAIEQQQYKAAYDAAKAYYDKAKQDYETYKDLASNNAIATQILEHAKADFLAAQSNLDAVESNLHNSIIYAPFSGTIGISKVKLGSAVTAGQTLMNTISSDDPVGIDISIDETLIGKFTNLLHHKYPPNDSTFKMILPDQSVYQYPGKLLLLDRAVDPQTGTLTARLEFPNKNDVLKPGLTCNIEILNNNTSESIIIPFKAVVVQIGEYFVFVIHRNKVSQREISVGRTIKDNVIVKNGLKPGEQIVVEGVQNLRDNSPVILSVPGNKTHI